MEPGRIYTVIPMVRVRGSWRAPRQSPAWRRLFCLLAHSPRRWDRGVCPACGTQHWPDG